MVATLHGIRRTMPVGADGVTPEAGPVTLTDHSITSATGASQTLLAANAGRRFLSILNPASNATDWIISPEGDEAEAGAACYTLRPGDEWNPSPPPANEVTGKGVAASTLTVKEG